MEEEVQEALATGCRMARSDRSHFRDSYPNEDAIRAFKRGVLGFLGEFDGGTIVEELREALDQ